MKKYGMCMGVPGHVTPHIFYDGKMHFPGSHGLCPECRRLALSLWRRQVDELDRAPKPAAVSVSI